MRYEYRELISTVKELHNEIIAACDAYKRREITSSSLKEIIMSYATAYPDKLFNGEDINPTVKAKIGKKRLTLLNTTLEGYQIMFKGWGNG